MYLADNNLELKRLKLPHSAHRSRGRWLEEARRNAAQFVPQDQQGLTRLRNKTQFSYYMNSDHGKGGENAWRRRHGLRNDTVATLIPITSCPYSHCWQLLGFTQHWGRSIGPENKQRGHHPKGRVQLGNRFLQACSTVATSPHSFQENPVHTSYVLVCIARTGSSNKCIILRVCILKPYAS